MLRGSQLMARPGEETVCLTLRVHKVRHGPRGPGSSPPVQVGGVAVLGVQRVGGDDRIVDLKAVQQRGEQGDFVGLGIYLYLA